MVNLLLIIAFSNLWSWIYVARLEHEPDRRRKIRVRSSFAFSGVRHTIADFVLGNNFHLICSGNGKLAQKSFIKTLLRLVA